MKGSIRVVGVVLCSTLSAPGAEVGVWSDPFLLKYATVQLAVNAAADGNTIRMETNVFFENVVVSNKNLIFEGGYDFNLFNRVGGYTAIDGSSAGLPLYFFASSSRVDSVNLVHGAGVWGGGALLKNATWVEFTNSSLCSNACVWAGGGLYVDGSSYAKLVGRSRVFTNAAISIGGGAWGGGVYVESSGRVDIVHEDADVFGNVVIDGNGGGIYVGDKGYLRLFQADVFNNTAISGPVSIVSAGGGIGASAAFIEAGDGAEIYGNQANWGGGLAVVASTVHLGRARADDIRIYGNMADQGGGLYSLESDISSFGSTWSNNVAVQEGGGMFLSGGEFLADTNKVLMLANRAGSHGGGICAYDSGLWLKQADIGRGGAGNSAGGMGGGIYGSNTTLIIYNTRFVGNSATNPAPGAGCGGGMAAIGGFLAVNYLEALPEWGTQTVFEANSAGTNYGNGGGLYLTDIATTSMVWFCTFRSNTAHQGGGLYANSAPFFLLDGVLERNTALSDGGGVNAYRSWAVVGCDVYGNESGRDGGGICSRSESLYVLRGRFLGNAATNNGGAICVLLSPLVQIAEEAGLYSATNGWPLLFEGNRAVNFYGGAMFATSCSNIVVRRAGVFSNSAPNTGGFYLSYSACRLEQCAIAANSDYGAAFVTSTGDVSGCTIVNNPGAGLEMQSESRVAVSNSIIWGNGQAVLAFASVCTVDYSDVQGGWAGTGNISTDPMLYANYHLTHVSPCIDAGSPGATGSDVDGEVRAGNWDMGCDEFIDTDADMLPDVVESGTGVRQSDYDLGTNPNDPESDGDNVNDGEEWIADTNPNDPLDSLRFTGIRQGAGAAVLEWAGGEQAFQMVEVALGPSNNAAWRAVYTNLPPTPLSDSCTADFGTNVVNFRLRAHR